MITHLSSPETAVIGYMPNEPVTFEEWCDTFQADLLAVHTVKEYMPWMLGDKYLYGENHFPDRFSQALPDPTPEEKKKNEDLPESSIRHYAWICEVFPIGERRPAETSRAVHVALAAIPDRKTRLMYLDRAIKEGWTYKQAEKEKKKLMGQPTEKSEPDSISLKRAFLAETAPAMNRVYQEARAKYKEGKLPQDLVDMGRLVDEFVKVGVELS